MYRVILLPRDADLRELRQALWAHRIGHRITEEDDGQVLWLVDPSQLEALRGLLEQWQRGEPLMPAGGKANRGSGSQWLTPFRRAPVTSLALGLCLLVFAATWLFGDLVIAALTIVPVGIVNGQPVTGSLAEGLASGQVWRLLSPIFLHFGWMHLIFNMLWLWFFGRQIEAIHGGRRMLTLLLLSGIGGNLAQYATGTVLFGGMSGVDFALLGYVWLMSRRRPGSGFFVPQMLVVFMLAWMVFTMTDVAALVGFGNVANEAHLGGLVVGLVLGWYHSRQKRYRR
ncbi:rhomboid family intramembrane serine protease [Halomonas elongata]|uniref:Peptidase S54 family protein n=1 Tax=Halomonas elongata (strain ATCC 33173 / DSM 2581 / NBRC 15536 / NCIMB 2198 / 1H9) TaxID=768066 RepID=E1V8R8_HALED|nr:rhomboid family intramembrane serine protease [Halomonas elongata]RAW06797.1 rhomboid family intramembrane serine protease [Halomonas elongata]WBF18934.1 rhomboid family intramembrane serine protease [Halomonas elongata]WPU47794.1 rhomboid family intramembrane serine protease [Halomonas elongata DSM 2581]WVI72437.1 rhomboid family intramembrane serine protease [Halomonas elongata]CBV41693.1 peptidase S54 family protein [Halomonas elongata DSM 2581]